MSRTKRLVFALVTVGLFLGILELAAYGVWAWMEARAFERTSRLGEEVLRNDGINFMKMPHGLVGYLLRPKFARGNIAINAQGFAQREEVQRARKPGTLRLMTLGESTTMGNDLDAMNYPSYLRRLLKRSVRGFSDVEVINAGVAGWVSDQIAIWSEEHLATYRPDLIILYVGWNDFQSYDPFGPPPAQSYFKAAYGGPLERPLMTWKSLALLSASWTFLAARFTPSPPISAPPDVAPTQELTYRYYRASLDRIVKAYRMAHPAVRVAVCTLVGRWPHGSVDDFENKPNGRTWWMKNRGSSPDDAASTLERFNQTIRAYAYAHELVLIDAARVFTGLDRAALQWDFAHMHAEGYELLAETIYRGLLEAGLLQGDRSPRFEELMTKYALPNRPA